MTDKPTCEDLSDHNFFHTVCNSQSLAPIRVPKYIFSWRKPPFQTNNHKIAVSPLPLNPPGNADEFDDPRPRLTDKKKGALIQRLWSPHFPYVACFFEQILYFMCKNEDVLDPPYSFLFNIIIDI